MSSASLWKVPAYLPYLQPPLTPATVARAEAQLGVKLPKAYVDALTEQNGGYVRLTLPESVHSMIWGIGPHFPSITEDFWWQGEELPEEGSWVPKDPKRLVPFDGDGHWHLCLDYRARGPAEEPSVAYVDLETESEERIAVDFAAFLALLKLDFHNDTVGISGDWSLEAAASALAARLKLPFEDQGSFDGYPVYRCNLGSEDEPQWLWLSPNEVPRGFARASEERYAELAGLMPGTALRFPEHPNARLILEFTDGAAHRVAKACADSSIATMRLMP